MLLANKGGTCLACSDSWRDRWGVWFNPGIGIRMTDSGWDLEVILRAATAGARSVSSRMRAVTDAVEVAVARWEDAIVRGRPFANVEAWAFVVARNAAKRWKRPEADLPVGRADDASNHAMEEGDRDRSEITGQPLADVVRHLTDRISFRGRQHQVLCKLCEPGMTLRRAAEALGMDRTNLRRAFRSALKRIHDLPK